MTDKDYASESLRIMNWIAENMKDADLMLHNHDRTISPNDCLELIGNLERNGLEYLLPIYLYASSFSAPIDYILQILSAHGLAAYLETKGLQSLTDDVKKLLKELT